MGNKRSTAENSILEIFGSNLRKIREEKNLSQEQIAYEADLSRSYYTEIETGKRNISLLNLAKIVSILEIEITTLIKLEDLKIIILNGE